MLKKTLLLLKAVLLVLLLVGSPSQAADEAAQLEASISQALQNMEIELQGHKGHLSVEKTSLAVTDQGGALVLGGIRIDVPEVVKGSVAEFALHFSPELFLMTKGIMPQEGRVHLPKVSLTGVRFEMHKDATVTIEENLLENASIGAQELSAIMAGTVDPFEAFKSLAVEKIALAQINVVNPPKGNAKETPLGSLGKLEITHLHEGTLESFLLKDLVVLTPMVRVALGNLSFKNVNFPSKEMLTVLGNEKALKELVKNKGYRPIIDGLFLIEKPVFESFTFGQIEANVYGFPVKLDEFGLGVERKSQMSLWVRGLAVENLLRLGIKVPEPLLVELRSTTDYTTDTPASKIHISSEKLGEVVIDSVTNLMDGSVLDFNLTYVDRGAVAWLMCNVSSAAQLQQYLEGILQNLSQSLGTEPVNERIVNAIEVFLQKPGTLTVRNRYGKILSEKNAEALLQNPGAWITVDAVPGTEELLGQVQQLEKAQTESK